jgi:hypothetical protein
MASSNRSKPPYKVGHRKPPEHTRFKKGQSGNPGGRRKGSQNLKTLIKQVLESEIEISDSGKKRKASLVEALILRQVQEAMRGHHRAIESLLDRFERISAAEEPARQELPEEDAAILERTLLSLRQAHDVRDDGEKQRDPENEEDDD